MTNDRRENEREVAERSRPREEAADELPLSVPLYQILLTLSDRRLHGYAMIQDIRERTGGEVELTASTLYAALKRMLQDGWIRELDEAPREVEGDDPRRRYYAITDLGRRILRLEAERLERAVRMARDKKILTEAPAGAVAILVTILATLAAGLASAMLATLSFPEPLSTGGGDDGSGWLRAVVDDHQVTDAGEGLAMVEPHLAVDPGDPDHLVAATIVAAPDRRQGPWHCAAMASFDGGSTWRSHDFDVERCIDPWVLITGAGEVMVALIEIRDDAAGDERFRLLVYRSGDGGRSWGEPMDLGRGFEHPTLTTTRYGEVLLSGRRTRVLSDGEVRYAFHLLAGRGFRERADVIASNLVNMPTRIVSLADGTLVTTLIDGARWRDGQPVDALETRRAWALRSRDGGESWSEPLFVSEACGVQGGFPGYPTLAVAPPDSPRGDRLYHLCVAENFEGVALTISDDAGEHWSTPLRLGREEPGETHARTAMLAVAPGGNVAIGWYDRSRERPEAGCQELVVRVSIDGGETFLPAVPLSKEPSCPDNPANGTVAEAWAMGGDYDSLAAGPDGTFHALWADARGGLFRLRHASFRVEP